MSQKWIRLKRYLLSRSVWSLACLTAAQSITAHDSPLVVCLKVAGAMLGGAVASDTLNAVTKGAS